MRLRLPDYLPTGVAKLQRADALSRNPILQEGEENSDQPGVKLYELAEKQEKEDNYNECDPPARILFVTRSTTRHAKRNRGQNGAQMSGSGESSGNLREKNIPHWDFSTDSDEQEDSAKDPDYREDSNTETRTRGPRRRRYRKQTEGFPYVERSLKAPDHTEIQ